MAIKTIIDRRGVVQLLVGDAPGTASTQLDAGVNSGVTGVSPGTLNVTSASIGSTLLPGFNVLSGSTTTTASLPNPGLYPGAQMFVRCDGDLGDGPGMLLTCSLGAFETRSIAAMGDPAFGSALNALAKSMTWFVSDGLAWLFLPLTGSAQIA